MSNISRAIPGLFGGVSQQFAAMRHPTQGELQDNALSTIVDGLSKRPGSTHIGFTPVDWNHGAGLSGNVFIHEIDRGAAGRWALMLDGTTAKIVNLATGASEAVNILSGGAYLASSDPRNGFRCVTVADTTFIVNTTKTVAALGGDGFANSTTTSYVYVRTAAQLQDYRVEVNGLTASYTSGATTTVGAVTAGLVAAIGGLAGTSAVAVSGIEGLIEVTTAAPLVTLNATDTFGNSTMVVMRNGVTKFSDLPPRFVTGPRVKIAGSGPNVDPYWVEWTGSQWTECREPGLSTGLDATTLPYKLTKTGGGGSWDFGPNTWTTRAVGDANTNPHPSFVGRTLRHIFFHRNRLGFLAGDSMVMSRAGLYFNFYAATATDVLDTDPIDLAGTGASVDTLDWAVPFNKELIIWASSNQQFSLAAGEVLSPNTAKLEPTTAFSSNPSACPQQLGNRIVYPNTTQGHTQLGLYKVSKDTVSNTMESITDHVPTYIPDNPLSIEVSEAFRIAAVVPPFPSKDLYVFKYEQDGDDKLTQRAWQRFIFGCDSILKAHWSGSKLYLFCYYRNAYEVTGVMKDAVALEVVDFDRSAVDAGTTISTRLDRKVALTSVTADSPVVGRSTLVLPFRTSETPVVLSITSQSISQLPVVSVTPGTTTTSVVVIGSLGPNYVVGFRYLMRYRFSEIFMRDNDGVPIMSLRMKVLKVLLRFVKTGFFKAKVTTQARGSYEYTYSSDGALASFGLGEAPSLVDGDFSIPVQAQNQGTVITLESDSFMPCSFPYAEWRASLNLKAKR